MCLSERSLRRWAFLASEHTDSLDGLPVTEVDEACFIWEVSVWPALDHSKRYCLNPKETIKAILREKTCPTVHERHRRRRFKSAAKDAAIVRRFESIFTQSPASSWVEE